MFLTGLMSLILNDSYRFVNRFGYIGIFITSLLGSATLFFSPIPTSTFPFIFGAVLNPLLIGIFGASGAAIGELTGYIMGLGSKELLEKKYTKKLERVKKIFERHSSLFWITFTVMIPFFPTDIIGIFCGMIRYDLKKFFIAVFIGKLVLTLALAYAGHYSIGWVLDFFQFNLEP